jgi:deoxyguanosine kinase
MKHKFITIIGPIASGKTTVSNLLSEKLKLPLVDADLFEQNPFLPGYIKNTPRWAFATELFFTIKRIKKLENLKRLLNKSSIIVDSGLIMSHQVYTKNHLIQGNMTAAEWDFFSEIIEDYKKSIPSPNIIIQLLAKPETQLKRIQKRGRSFESGYTLKYLNQITDRLDEFARSIQNQPDTTLITFNTEKYNILSKPGSSHLLTQIKSSF